MIPDTGDFICHEPRQRCMLLYTVKRFVSPTITFNVEEWQKAPFQAALSYEL